MRYAWLAERLLPGGDGSFITPVYQVSEALLLPASNPPPSPYLLLRVRSTNSIEQVDAEVVRQAEVVGSAPTPPCRCDCPRPFSRGSTMSGNPAGTTSPVIPGRSSQPMAGPSPQPQYCRAGGLIRTAPSEDDSWDAPHPACTIQQVAWYTPHCFSICHLNHYRTPCIHICGLRSHGLRFLRVAVSPRHGLPPISA